MRIGIDARFFGPKGKGLGRYTQKLVENLEKIDRDNQYVIFLRRENWEDYQPSAPNFKKVLADYKWYGLAEQILMPIVIRRARVNLMHFPHFNVPIFYFGKFVVTIHDLILRRFPTRRASTKNFFVYWLKNLGYRFVIWLAVKRAKKVIAVSEYVKEDIKKVFSLPELKINVTYEGVNELVGNPENAEAVLTKYQIRQPFALYVGNAYPHKNLERLIESFLSLSDSDKKPLQLVLVGEMDYFYQRLKQFVENKLIAARNLIVFADYVKDMDLAAFYQKASVYVFPSLCEGFGLPPLEAMAKGVPVACSNASCLPEILGDAAAYFDPLNVSDMAEKISQVVHDEVLRWVLISRGLERVKKYSWRKMAEETLDLYLGA